MASKCFAAINLCAVRATRLDSLGAPTAGPNNAYVTNKPISLGVSPQVVEGNESDLIGGCECLIASYKGDDKLKRLDFELALGQLEPALLEILTGGSAIVQDGVVTGMWLPGQASCDATPQPNVCLEGWQQSWEDDHQAAAPMEWVHWVFPATRWQLGDFTMEADFAQPTLKGFSRSNPNWGLGIYGDQPEAVPGDTPGGFFFTGLLPAGVCDYQSSPLT